MHFFKSLSKLSILMLVVFFASCAKDSTPNGDLNGTYTGTYLETGSLQDSGTVKIVFIGSVFSGESMGTSRPICNGSYAIIGDSIDFTNLCTTPRPELLLAGNYQFLETSDSLYFTRIFTGTGGYQELFSLKKQ